MKSKHQHKTLETFFKEVAFLTGHHRNLGDKAVVFADDLGKALAKVDSTWHVDIPKRKTEQPAGYNPA